MRETKIILTIAVITVGVFASFRSESGSSQVGGAYVEGVSDFPIATDRLVLLPEQSVETLEPEILAGAALVKDIYSGSFLYEKHIDKQLPIASLTKMLTAIVVENKIAEGETVRVDSSDTGVVPFTAQLKAGEKYSARDLLAAMLVASSNDAALALARHFGPGRAEFVRQMNREAEILGMTSSSFDNPVGFDDPDNFSTARDLMYLVDEFLTRADLMEVVALKQVSITELDGGGGRLLLSTNKLLSEDPRIKGIKTGYTDGAQGSMAVFVNDAEHPYYVVVLGSEDREADVQALIDWVEGSFQWN